MNQLWWSQIRAVIRLEIKKTFFARRGIWIYLVAFLPVLLFVAYGIAAKSQENRAASIARQGQKVLSSQALLAIKPGMSKEQVIGSLGKAPVIITWESGPGAPVHREHYEYSDGEHRLFVEIVNGKVEGVRVNDARNPGDESVMFAGVFQFFFLRLAVFFGCLGVFMNLFRGEILDRSLHFYFLASMRREVLTVGKFLAGLIATCTIFVTSELLQNVVFLWHFPATARDFYLYHNHGLEQVAAYLGVTLLACIGYGSFFLIAGMLFRNPILPT